MATKSTSEVWSEIQGVTKPLENTLKALAENLNGSAAGKAQAQSNLEVVQNLNTTGAQLAAQATQTQSLGMGMRRGGSSAPDDRAKDDDKDK